MKREMIVFRILLTSAIVIIGFLPVFLLLSLSGSPRMCVFAWFFVVLAIVVTSQKPLKNQGTVLFICILTLLVLMMVRPWVSAWLADCFRPSYLKCLSKEDKIIYYESNSNVVSYITDIVGIRTTKNPEEILKEIERFRNENLLPFWGFWILYSESHGTTFTMYLEAKWED